MSALGEIRAAVEKKDISKLIVLAKRVKKEEASEALALYEKYYKCESEIASGIQDILARARIHKTKLKTPPTGSYIYDLED